VKAFVKTTLFIVALTSAQLAGTQLVSADVYKYIDENGNVAYGDKPIDGSEKVKIPGVKSNSRSNSGNKTASNSNSQSDDLDEGQDEEGAIETTDYKDLAVLTPRQGRVVDPENGTVQIIMLPTPSLASADQLVINIDGKDVNKGREVNLSVQNLTDGPHTVKGRILGQDGKVIIESASVKFQVGKN